MAVCDTMALWSRLIVSSKCDLKMRLRDNIGKQFVTRWEKWGRGPIQYKPKKSAKYHDLFQDIRGRPTSLRGSRFPRRFRSRLWRSQYWCVSVVPGFKDGTPWDSRGYPGSVEINHFRNRISPQNERLFLLLRMLHRHLSHYHNIIQIGISLPLLLEVVFAYTYYYFKKYHMDDSRVKSA